VGSACSAGGLLLGVTDWLGTPRIGIKDLLGLACGGSTHLRLRASRRRIHEAADVGATCRELAGGYPEGDPRNPAVIADNVGEQRRGRRRHGGTCSRSMRVPAVDVMLSAHRQRATTRNASLALPVSFGGFQILRDIGTPLRRVRKAATLMNALFASVLVREGVSAIGFIRPQGLRPSGRSVRHR